MCWRRHLAAVVQASAPQVRAPTVCLCTLPWDDFWREFQHCAWCAAGMPPVSSRWWSCYALITVLPSRVMITSPSSLCCPPTCLFLRMRHAWHFEWHTVHLLNAPAIVLCTFAVLARLNVRQNVCLRGLRWVAGAWGNGVQGRTTPSSPVGLEKTWCPVSSAGC